MNSQTIIASLKEAARENVKRHRGTEEWKETADWRGAS
jgi:hypothetical protein